MTLEELERKADELNENTSPEELKIMILDFINSLRIYAKERDELDIERDSEIEKLKTDNENLKEDIIKLQEVNRKTAEKYGNVLLGIDENKSEEKREIANLDEEKKKIKDDILNIEIKD